MRKRNLGRYLLGLGIGLMLGVLQMVTVGQKVWWWGILVALLAAGLMVVGFEWSQSPVANGTRREGVE